MLRRLAIASVALVVVTAAACTSSGSTSGGGGSGTTAAPGTTAGPGSPGFNQATDAFYQAPSPLPAGKPGDVIRSQPLAGAPAGSQAWKVLYLSTGIDGKPVAVSGVVVAPTGAAPAGGRPVVGWAHPTTGVVDRCAPSELPEVFALIPGLQPLLQAGYVVAATDYEGLGTDGVHPYLVGVSEGRGVLDSVRAARNLPDAGAGPKLLLWGHSQGGQGSLFAGELAATYAPELQLQGVAAAAPAGMLGELLTDDEQSVTGVTLGAYAFNAYRDVYGPTTPGMDINAVLTPQGQQALPTMVGLCDVLPADYQQLVATATPLIGTFYVGQPANQAPWSTLLAQNTPGQAKTAAPILITQGTGDTVVVPSTTEQGLVPRLCGLGDAVQLKLYPAVSHTEIGYASAADVATWFGQVLAGQTPPGTCGAAPAGTAGTTGAAGTTPPGTTAR